MEGLSSRCVHLSTRAKGSERDAAWDWLAKNNMSSLTTSANNDRTSYIIGDSGMSSSSSVDAAWKLLERTIQRLEKPGSSEIHKAVANRLIAQGTALPVFLVNAYKKVCPDCVKKIKMLTYNFTSSIDRSTRFRTKSSFFFCCS